MNRFSKKKKDLKRRHLRLRHKVSGTAERPRLNVFRSLRNIYVQLIDDVQGVTLASVSTQSPELKGQAGGNVEAAKLIGKLIAEKAKEKQITSVVFDRGGRKYHGRVKALAEAARENGLQF